MAGLQSEGLHFCILVYPLGSLWFLPFSKRPSCSQLRWNGTLKDGFFKDRTLWETSTITL